MKNLLFLLLLPSLAFSQSEEIKAINAQVWEPFMVAYRELDAEKFISIHSKDVTRVSRNSHEVSNYDQYSNQMRTWFTQLKSANREMEISFRFFERFYSTDLGSEVGIYRLTIGSGETKKSYYGKFHVVLRKEADGWKILMDSDSNEGNSIGEEDYESGFALGNLEEFNRP